MKPGRPTPPGGLTQLGDLLIPAFPLGPDCGHNLHGSLPRPLLPTSARIVMDLDGTLVPFAHRPDNLNLRPELIVLRLGREVMLAHFARPNACVCRTTAATAANNLLSAREAWWLERRRS